MLSCQKEIRMFGCMKSCKADKICWCPLGICGWGRHIRKRERLRMNPRILGWESEKMVALFIETEKKQVLKVENQDVSFETFMRYPSRDVNLVAGCTH